MAERDGAREKGVSNARQDDFNPKVCCHAAELQAENRRSHAARSAGPVRIGSVFVREVRRRRAAQCKGKGGCRLVAFPFCSAQRLQTVADSWEGPVGLLGTGLKPFQQFMGRCGIKLHHLAALETIVGLLVL